MKYKIVYYYSENFIDFPHSLLYCSYKAAEKHFSKMLRPLKYRNVEEFNQYLDKTEFNHRYKIIGVI